VNYQPPFSSRFDFDVLTIRPYDYRARFVGAQYIGTNERERAKDIGTGMSVLVAKANGDDRHVGMDSGQE
jgi:hypothetical protein